MWVSGFLEEARCLEVSVQTVLPLSSAFLSAAKDLSSSSYNINERFYSESLSFPSHNYAATMLVMDLLTVNIQETVFVQVHCLGR